MRMRIGSKNSRAYMYSFKRQVYLSISVPRLNPSVKNSVNQITFLLMLSVLTEVKNRLRLIATVMASIALLLLNGFVPLGPIITIVLLVVSIILLVIAFIIARGIGRVELSDERMIEGIHEKLYETNLEYRRLYDRIKEFSMVIVEEILSVTRGRRHTSIHIPSFGIYSVRARIDGDVVEMELRKVASSMGPSM